MTSSSAAPGRRWAALGVIYLCALAFAVTLQSIPPLLSLIITELDISYTEAGLLMSMFALPGIIVSLPAGMLADRYGQKTIGIFSFALMLLGHALFASGVSLPMLIAGRVIAGAGAMTLIILLPQMLTQWFMGKEMGVAMGIFNTGMPLGTIFSLNVLSLLAERWGWRTSAWIGLAVPVIAYVVFIFLFATPPGRERPGSSKREGFFQGIKLVGRPIWLVGISWALFNAAMISMFTFTPDFLRTSGFNPAEAGLTTSVVMWPSLVLSPFVGYLIDRFGRKRTLVAAGSVVIAMLLVMVPQATGWILVLMVLIGIAQTLVPAPVMSLTPEVVRPERLGLGFGVVSICMNLGIIIGPAMVGFAKDVTGSFVASYVLMASFALLVAVVIVLLRPRRAAGTAK